jgi:hypothetical protein
MVFIDDAMTAEVENNGLPNEQIAHHWGFTIPSAGAAPLGNPISRCVARRAKSIPYRKGARAAACRGDGDNLEPPRHNGFKYQTAISS